MQNVVYELLEVKPPELFEGVVVFDCVVQVGSMAPRLEIKKVSAKCRNGEVIFNLGDWQHVIAWREEDS